MIFTPCTLHFQVTVSDDYFNREGLALLFHIFGGRGSLTHYNVAAE